MHVRGVWWCVWCHGLIPFFGLGRCGGQWVALLGQEGEEVEMLYVSPRLDVHSVTRSATSIERKPKEKITNLITTHLFTRP